MRQNKVHWFALFGICLGNKTHIINLLSTEKNKKREKLIILFFILFGGNGYIKYYQEKRRITVVE